MIETLIVAILVLVLLILILWAVETLLPIDVQTKRIVFFVVAVIVIVLAILALTGHAIR